MTHTEVFVDRMLEDGRVVVTNNSHWDIPVGTSFIALQLRRHKLAGDLIEAENLSEPEAISLELVEIDVSRNAVATLPRGYSAAVRFRGAGEAKIVQLLLQKQCSEFVFLSSGSDAA